MNKLLIAIFANLLAIKAIDMAKKVLNRLKIVLVEHGRTNKWLADKLGKNTTTVSRWCTNDMQPSVETLFIIARTLNIDVRELLVATK